MKCADNIALFKVHYFKSIIFKRISHFQFFKNNYDNDLLFQYVRDPCIIWLFYTYTNNVGKQI